MMAARQRTPEQRTGARPPRRSGEGPLRRCIASGAVRMKAEMVRFVVAPDGNAVADVEGRLPGRGMWLSADRDMVNKACRKGLFSRAARTRVSVPDDLADRVEGLLLRRCLDLIGLARRAGLVVTGSGRTGEWLRAGRAGVLLGAADAAPGGRAKMRALAPGVPLVELFSGAEQGSAVGRDGAVHMAMGRGPLADALMRETGRLAGFRQAGAANDGDEPLGG